MDSEKCLIKVLLLCFLFGFTVSIDTITPNHSVKDDGNLIVSGGKVFALGFFSPGSSKYRYIGIWYNQVPERTVVWVANRDNPIDDNSGVLSIDSQGSLALYEKNKTLPVWSANVSAKAGSKNSMAQLLDTGNLVLLQDDTKGTLLWQSFDYPSNTLLPLMKLGIDLRTGLNRFLTSWKSQDDPGIGNYSYRIDPTGFPQVSLYNGSDLQWRTGSWTGQKLTGVPEMSRSYIFNVSFVNSDSEIAIMYSVTRPSIITRMLVTESGIIQRFTWNAKDGHWIGFWSAPKEQCDSYNHCGPNSNCNPYTPEKFECTCLPGYEPKAPEDWYLRDGSGGCIRKRGAYTCQRGEGFVKVARVKTPDTSAARANMSLGLKQCEEMCLGNCSCMAYASAYYQSNGGIGCLMWQGDLMDTRSYNDDGQDLYVRVDAMELAQYAKKKDPLHKKGILASLAGSVAAAMLFMAVFIYCFVRRKTKGTRRQSSRPFSYRSSLFLADSVNRKDQLEENASTDLPFFNLSTVAAATNNFSLDNKLGEGGFGSVYKGVLFDGKEIAVKRLSKYSGQGIDEFKNEIMLIAKLQHRNLVRMIGCCIEEEEKMLVYEYLPNKSLDSFIFDETKKLLLDWKKRFEIICGIARGILYLHQDSRLRIIHRDLKASNVLLDAAMNPKISDFGMARMFGGEQIEGKTRRIVGTYGYMSPEYAMKGLFSIKSDVYSFGVLLLEIISGIKNSSYCPDDSTTNLIEHVWDLWKEGKAMEIVDSSLWENSAYLADDEVLRCIQIGLLCVQECATDRPAMSSVVFMLGNAEAILPRPSQPAFAAKKKENGEEISNSEGTGGSVNEVTITKVQGR